MSLHVAIADAILTFCKRPVDDCRHAALMILNGSIREIEGNCGGERVLRKQGGSAVVCKDVDVGAEGSKNRVNVSSGADRYAGV